MHALNPFPGLSSLLTSSFVVLVADESVLPACAANLSQSYPPYLLSHTLLLQVAPPTSPTGNPTLLVA